MKQITIQCNLDGSTSWVDKDQYTILSNENNATQVTIRFPSAYTDYKKMFDIFVGYDKTGNTEPAILSRTTGDTLTFVLDNSYMKKGYIHIQPIATKAVSGQSVDDTVKWKVVTQIPVRTSLDITEDTTTPSVVQSLENYINAEIADLDASLAIKAVNVTTLEAGASATGSMVREADGLTLSLGIPTGAKIVSAGFNEADLVFTLDDGSTVSIVNAYVTLHGEKGDKGNQWRGAYSAGTAYIVDDVVSYNGSAYICILASTGNLPTNTTYFSMFAQKGDNTSAENVTNTPAGGLSGNTVQLALNELDTEKADKTYVDTQDALKAPINNPSFTGKSLITRDVADDVPALTVNQQNASSTGNIQEYKFNNVLVGYVDKYGTIAGGSEQTVTNKNKYYPLLKDITGNVIARRLTQYWTGSAYAVDYSNGFGYSALQYNTGASSNGFGYLALYNNTGSSSNGFGYSALSNNTGASSNGFGYSALSNNTGASSNGFGHASLQNNTGASSNGFGHASLQNNTGGSSNGFGVYALYNNTGGSSNGFGYGALQYNTGASSNGFGYLALSNNTGASSNGFGHASLQNNTGAYSNGFGHLALQYNTGSSSNGLGYSALQYNTGVNSNGFGVYALRHNQKDNNTVLGHASYGSVFLDNTSGNKVCASTAIDVSLDRVTLTGHGFGATNSFVNIKYASTDGTAIGGLTVGSIYQIKIIDANTIEFRTSGRGIDITSQGTGNHTFTPQYAYTNTTSLGANTSPNKDNQVVLGDVNVDTVKMGGATRTPASATATGVKGEWCWDASYIYVCVATNTWKRTALATW